MLASVGCFYVLFTVKIPVWHNGHNKKWEGDWGITKGDWESVEYDTWLLRGQKFGEGRFRLVKILTNREWYSQPNLY